MAVAHDLATESHTGTTGSASEASFSWSHGGAASNVKGVLVFVFGLSVGTSDVVRVTYGGAPLWPVSGGFATDVAGEPGCCQAFFLGSGIPQGTQTVVVTRNNNANILYAAAATVTATSTMDTQPTGVAVVEGDGTLAEQSITDGSPGTNSVRYAGTFSGLATPPGVGASSTALVSIDLTALGAAVCRETTAGQGARNVGFSSGTSDDRAGVYLAIKEVTPQIFISNMGMAPVMKAA